MQSTMVALVIVALTVLYDDVIVCVDLDLKRIKTPVARYFYDTFAMKRAVVDVVPLLKVKMHLDIRFVDVGALHVLEELGVYDKILPMVSIPKLGELHLVCREFSHDDAVL